MTRRSISAVLAIAAVAIFAQSAGAAPTAVDSGAYASCYLDGGGAYCWSGGSETWLYDYPPGAPSTSAPTLFAGLTSGVTDISVSSRHACAVVNGAAKCWGNNDDAQLGDPAYPDSTVPVAVLGLSSGVTDVDAGDDYSCAVTSGVVKCWGASDGIDFPASPDDYSYTAQTIPGLGGGASAVATGYDMACAIISGGVKCWGRGWLGDGTEHGAPALVNVTGLESNVTDIAVSGKNACAVQSGALKCWGEGTYGVLGNGGGSYVGTPVTATGLGSGVTDVSIGYYTACAAVSGSVKCWGWGLYGLLGGGVDGAQQFTAADVPGLINVGATAVSTGPFVNCAIASGTVGCWGDNEAGMLGDGVLINALKPKSVAALASGVTDISAGYDGGCAVVSGAGKCWGNLKHPTSSNASQGYESATPTTVPGLESGVSDIDVDHWGCATVSAAVKCWADSVLGNPPSATVVTGGTSGATTLDSIDGRGCAVISGAAKCGNTVGSYDRELLSVAGLESGVTQVAQSATHRCAVVNQAAKCWGTNYYGELGTGDYEDSETPVQVSGLTSGVTSITAGTYFSCAIVSGAAKCWGDGASAQLGDGELTESNTPVQVDGLTSGVTSISAGDDNTCAVKSGDVYCWGVGDEGEIGDNNRFGSTVPVKALDLPNTVTQVSAGHTHNCAIAAGAAYCWGSNSHGQLAQGTTFGPRGAGAVAAPDNAPSVGFVKPIMGSLINTKNVSVSIESANASEVTCKLDGGAWVDCASGFANVSEGDHRIRAAAVNDEDQFSIADTFFTLDSIPPKVTILSPANGSAAATSTPTLYFDIDDPDYTYVECTLDGKLLLDEVGDSEYCDWLTNLPTLSVGKHTLVVSAYDRAGNAGSTTSVFTFGTIPQPSRADVAPHSSLLGKVTRSKSSMKVKFGFSFAPPSGVSLSEACQGSVLISTRFGKRKLSEKNVKLAVVSGACVATARFSLPKSTRGKKVTFDAYFAGNAAILPVHTVKKLRIKR